MKFLAFCFLTLFSVSCVAQSITLTLAPNVGTPFWVLNQTILDKYDYSVTEYFGMGTAEVFTLSSTVPRVLIDKQTTVNYNVPIKVYTPNNRFRFNGNVLVELENPTAGFGVPFVFDYTYDYLLSRGYSIVTIPIRTGPVQYFPYWNPVRYAGITMPMGTFPQLITAVLAKIRSSDLDNPLKSYIIRSVGLTTYSQSGGELLTWLNYFFPIAPLTSNGRQLVDTFLFLDPTTNGAEDPFTTARYNEAPTRYVNFTASGSAKVLRTRSSELLLSEFSKRAVVRVAESTSTDNYFYRDYEINSAHLNDPIMSFFNTTVYENNIENFQNPPTPLTFGIAPPSPCVYPDTVFPVQDFMSAIIQAGFEWANLGITPTHGDQYWFQLTGPIPIDSDKTTPEPTIQKDQYGNYIGGVPYPQNSVPISVLTVPNPALPYFNIHNINDWCHANLRGYDNSTVALQSLYRNHGSYVAKVSLESLALVEQGLLLLPNALEYISDAAKSNVGKH